MFLNYLSSHNHRMSDCYCGLQKSIREGNINKSIYWASQIGNNGNENENEIKGYPNALRKRLCQISLEDCCSWEYSKQLLLNTKNNNKASFNELLPWVLLLVKLSKTHSAAWLQRVATQYIFEGGNIPSYKYVNIHNTNEIEFASLCMIAHRDNNINIFNHLCGDDSKIALSIYKYINNDPLVFHAWQMHQRRNEISNRIIELKPLSFYGITDDILQQIINTRIELDDRWYDKHTKKGKKLGRGYEHFFEIMIFHPRLYPLNNGDCDCDCDDNNSTITKITDIRKDTEPYEGIAKTLYLDFRIDGKEVKSKELLSIRRSKSHPKFLDLSNGDCKLLTITTTNNNNIEDDNDNNIEEEDNESLKRNHDEIEITNTTTTTDVSSKKQRHDNSTTTLTTSSSTNSNLLRDIDIFEINSESKFLGYKNITIICTLKKQIDELHNLSIGDQIFVKIGEGKENCQFSLTCEKMRNELGMVNYFTQSIILWVLPTLNYPELVGEQHPNWIQSITRHYNSFKNKYTNNLNMIPIYITGVFKNNLHLCDAFHSKYNNNINDNNNFIHSREFGKQLLEILLFRKYFGISDTNGTNILINLNDRLIYSIDENMASSQQLSSYVKNGLITSQKINKQILIKVGNYLLENKNNVKETILFINKMRELNIPSHMNMERMIETHNKCPFDNDTRQFLEEYSNNENNDNNIENLRKLKNIIINLKLSYSDIEN